MSDRNAITAALMRLFEPSLETQIGVPELNKMLLSRRVGGPATPKAPDTFVPKVMPPLEYGNVLRGISSRVNPERFEQAWKSWEPSENIVDWRMGPNRPIDLTQKQPRSPRPDAPGWEWYQP